MHAAKFQYPITNILRRLFRRHKVPEIRFWKQLAQVVRRRAAEVDSGEVQPVSWQEVKRSAWEALDQEGASPNG